MRETDSRAPRLRRDEALATVSSWSAEAERPYALAKSLLTQDVVLLQQFRVRLEGKVMGAIDIVAFGVLTNQPLHHYDILND